MLSREQKLSIAGGLSTSNLQQYEIRIRKLMGEVKLFETIGNESLVFAQQINKHYVKRDGFIPRKVLELINT